MNTKELLKRAAIAPIALASAGGGYYLASTEIEDANSKVSQVEEQLEKSLQIIEQLQAQNDVNQWYGYLLL